MKEAIEKLNLNQKDEADYKAQLELKDAFSGCAVRDVLEKRQGGVGRNGLGFPIVDIARFGMTNNVYLCEVTYEKDSSRFRQNLWLITADECQALMK